nr:hypothetical protein [Tanacetum cinerariifolium]
SSQSPPNIDHCCYECGDPLDGIFCKQCTSESPFTLDSTPTYVDESPNVFNPPPQPPVYPCEFCGNDARYGHYCTPQAQSNNPKQGYSQDLNFPAKYSQFSTTKQEEKRIEEEQAAKARYWKIPACCDDDDDYDSAITPILSTEEPIDSLSMRDEHLDTSPATESDELIKSCVENLVPNPSESEGE